MVLAGTCSRSVKQAENTINGRPAIAQQLVEVGGNCQQHRRQQHGRQPFGLQQAPAALKQVGLARVADRRESPA